MSHDVFISYSSKDKNAADAVCAVLEQNGIRCWIAPRDVLPGTVWGAAIVGAIQSTKVMVLVFSGAANTSPQIEREVERAISKGIPVVPFRIEDVQPSDSLEYFISASHWLDAFTDPMQQHLEALARVVRRFIEFKQAKDADKEGPADRAAADAVPLASPPPASAPMPAAQPREQSPQPVKASPVSAPPVAQERPRRWPYVAAASLVACGVLLGLYMLSGSGPASRSRQVGAVFRDCANCPDMVVVPPGRFLMGAAEHEMSIFDWARPLEAPVHEVRIAKPFAVGVFAITRDQFDEFVRLTNNPVEGGCHYWGGDKEALDPTRSFRDPKLSGGSQAGDHPAVCVSLQEATRFAAWLSGKTGRNYRLLSDAEHEYVTRGGTVSAFWWGASISADQANYWSDPPYKDTPRRPARFVTLPVKSFQPNPWGLYQVHGNVAEWVADCWHANYSGAPSDGSAWQGDDAGCKERTIRGGAFMNGADFLRSAHRRMSADIREIAFGFRIAQTLE